MSPPAPAEWTPAETLPFDKPTTRVEIDQIRGTGPTDIWLLCRGLQDGFVQRLGFHSDGKQWRSVPLPSRARQSIWPRSPSDVWAVGVQGTLAHFDGSTWQVIKAPGVQYDFLDVWVGDDGVVWIAAAGPQLTRYQNGQWDVLTSPELGPAANSLHSVTGIGREVLATGNALNQPSWVARYQGGAWRRDEVGKGGIVLIAASSPTDIWAVSRHNQAFHSDGTRWTRYDTTPLEMRAVAIAAGGEAWLVGEAGTILHWDGAALRPSPSGTQEGLWSVYAPARGQVLVGGSQLYRYNPAAKGAAGTR
jgi:hypothetical protein